MRAWKRVIWAIAAVASSALASLAQETPTTNPVLPAGGSRTEAAAPVRPSTSESRASASPQSGGYWIRTKGDEVNLRSRPDQNSAVVARVPRDAPLRAISEEYGWHKVLPPAGTFSYVNAEFVESKSDTEGVVSVRSGNLRVRVGSTVSNLAPDKNDVQVLLPAGTAVRILGKEGNWLKIEPPQGVYFYVSTQFTETISADFAARLGAPKILTETASQTPTTGPASRPAVAHGTASTQPSASGKLDVESYWGSRLYALEVEIEIEGRKPADQQNYSRFTDRLNAIATQTAEPVPANRAAGWLQKIRQRQADRDTAKKAVEITQKDDSDRARFDREQENLRNIARQKATTDGGNEVRGLIERSFVMRNGANVRRVKVQDPTSAKVLAYLEFSGDSRIDLDAFIGKYAVVRGPRRFDESLGADVLRVESISLAQAPAAAAEPAKPANPPASQPAAAQQPTTQPATSPPASR